MTNHVRTALRNLSAAAPRVDVAAAPAASAPAAPEAAEGYVCPMHPEGTTSRLLPA